MLPLAVGALAFNFGGVVPRPGALTSSRAAVSMGLTLDDKSEPLKFYTMTNAAGDSAKVYLMGACITSYVVDGNDALMVRPDAKMDGSKPISGGIPFCFPQFGPGELQQHGFARNLDWDVVSAADGDAPTLVLGLKPSEYTTAMWDHPFDATYTITLAKGELQTSFKVANTGDEAFEFTGALHSYWAVSAIDKVSIEGAFEGKKFLNKMADPPALQDAAGAAITISEETDAVYEGVGGTVTIKDSGKKSAIEISSSGWEDTVVWNPYGNEGMGYDSFVCVEAAKALKPITVAPGKDWEGVMNVKQV
jgi:glucose-6-phosphate 1-epimerase|tara:strand:+ start:704 stop:1621 length:918 start_codon:yes stop_codon:yes gene_type:complete